MSTASGTGDLLALLDSLPIPPRTVQLVMTPKYSRRQAKDPTCCNPYPPIASPLVVTRLGTPTRLGDPAGLHGQDDSTAWIVGSRDDPCLVRTTPGPLGRVVFPSGHASRSRSSAWR